jgi:hypothetical protein
MEAFFVRSQLSGQSVPEYQSDKHDQAIDPRMLPLRPWHLIRLNVYTGFRASARNYPKTVLEESDAVTPGYTQDDAQARGANTFDKMLGR